MEDKADSSSPGPVTVKVLNFRFTDVDVFLLTLCGPVTFDKCLFSFKTYFFLDIQRGNNEPEPTGTTYSRQRISIVSSLFKTRSGMLFINVYHVARKVVLFGCNFNTTHLYLNTCQNFYST